jgi:hypothetical protein
MGLRSGCDGSGDLEPDDSIDERIRVRVRDEKSVERSDKPADAVLRAREPVRVGEDDAGMVCVEMRKFHGDLEKVGNVLGDEGAPFVMSCGDQEAVCHARETALEDRADIMPAGTK